MEEQYSVLMSVYYNEDPEWFKVSVESMINQTVPPNEIIIVKDGPLSDELEQIVSELEQIEIIKFISLEKNVGLGNALSIGIKSCKNKYIARMDTDDISLKNRCESQLNYFKQNPDISVVGTTIAEFIDNPNNVVSYRKVPLLDKDIKKHMKKRNPINHVSVMFKKDDVINSGNYKHWNLNEDYYLWIRMMLHGYKFANINETLVKVRINNDSFKRRGGLKYFMIQKELFDYMLKKRVINLPEYIYNNFVRLVVRLLLPNKLRKWFYLKFLRS